MLRINEDLNNHRIINARVQSMELYFRSTRRVFIILGLVASLAVALFFWRRLALLQTYGISLGERHRYVAMIASVSEERLRESGTAAGKDLAAVQSLDTIRNAVPEEYELGAAFTRDDEIAILIGTDASRGGGDAIAGDAIAAGRLAEGVYRRIGELVGASGDTPIVEYRATLLRE